MYDKIFGTNHHKVFEKWWDYAKDNYISWENEKPVSVDLYYDPIVDEHIGRGPMGIITPVWYFAPQKREIAEIGWRTLANFYGVLDEGKITGLDDPAKATNLLQLAGEFCDPSVKNRLWDAAEEFIEPIWDTKDGEFYFGLRLKEAYPRGQWNARIMAGWVCRKNDWSKIFNNPNLKKFSEPTIEGVDFPNFALSEARWTGSELLLQVHAKNKKLINLKTKMKLVNIDPSSNWILINKKSGGKQKLNLTEQSISIEVSESDGQVILFQCG